MRRNLVVTLGLALILATACGGGDDKKAAGPVDAGTPVGDGVVSAATGTLVAAEGLPEGQGSILLDFIHTDRAVNQKVKVTLLPSAGGPTAKGEGNQAFKLAAGSYDAEVSYSESEVSGRYEGTLKGLQVHEGKATRYQVNLSAPVGLLKLQFKTQENAWKGEETVTGKVEITLWGAEDDPDLITPLYRGVAGEWLALKEGEYKAKAVYTADNGVGTTEWYQDLNVAGAMSRTDKTFTFELDFSGMRLDAFNYGRDVNARTTVYFYRPGADMDYAVAVNSGPAGTIVPVDPGEYDVRVVYLPTDSLALKGELVIQKLKVPDRGGLRQQVDLTFPLSQIKIKVTEGDKDVSERVEIRVLKTGADPEAAAATLDDVGVGVDFIPIGTYDIYLTYKPLDGPPRVEPFRGVDLGNGYVWEQNFDTGSPTWEPAPARRPQTALAPLQWRRADQPTGGDDDDSARGDDDSADDDDSAKQ